MSNEIQDGANAVPTKQFFVSMLTRDISLEDAILDLVDNCLDGALRIANGSEVNYAQHFVHIKLSGDSFLIEDNCGGIPQDIAKNYAFKMGRDPDDNRDSTSETIGMYGVGMKRAIFKMGQNATVQSLYGDESFEVPITPDWLRDKEWNPLPMLPLEAANQFAEPGTRIRVTQLYPGVAKHFDNAAFENGVRTSISEHFTVFLQRGLSITVNDTSVGPVDVKVLVSEQNDGPAPYVFQDTFDGVAVTIAVGLNTGRGLSSGDDEDVPDFERERSAATAGWTVYCNDRAVIVGDKSRITGWGDGIPLYHYQFSIITGIIEFKSKRAESLPVTTTKRALDTSSDVWLRSLVKMKEGLRIWISYTNAWKNHPRANQTVYWETARPLDLDETVVAVSKRENAVKADGSIEFNPQKRHAVPLPPTLKPSSRRIVFSRPIEEIKAVSKCLFDVYDEKPGAVGDKCFELVLNKVRDVETSNE